MTDADLLAYGCAMSFLVLAGVYVYLRASFETGTREAEQEAREESRVHLRDVG